MISMAHMEGLNQDSFRNNEKEEKGLKQR